MKKNGFTLIEILGVVVILSLIALLSFPSIVENVRKTENKLSDASMLLVESGVDIYMDNNKVDFKMAVNDVYCISFQTLFVSGNLRKPFIDIKTGKELDVKNKSVKVIVGSEDNTYNIVDSNLCIPS
ncbi:MAG: type II secretion system protein [Bacilli bacterium]